ncbi:leucine-rich repeat and IQ domain-containing 3 [Brachionus plicatilis]|uniref:Leucine-rich repeat and IQ domain-containing 3 n=1 Tax=Brachionus plicatilis TaxID=10195 RepID=A0A3M7SDZ6_BRAPC|nr:leucine-rich repeat and IQ domain-containing 3 [Brachionus plicatilis]
MSSIKFPKLNNEEKSNYNAKNLNKTIQDATNDQEQRAAILDAIKIGYLLYPSRDLIWDIFKVQADYDEKKCRKLVRKSKRSKLLVTESLENDYSKILFLNMTKIPLFEIGDLLICRNIVILNLSNNFLMNIEPLADCTNLVRLDLQNNQLSKLPSEEFWLRFYKLKILFLHNNHIGKLEYLKYISYCPSLEILTLFDSPISLKHNYRHHAVNSIVTLKALDFHVISDEEIIEEAVFKNAFSACSENFRIDLTIKSKENSFIAEMQATYQLMRQINQILAKFSPVIVIQRYIRGFLIRRTIFKAKMQQKIQAVVKIQKWWRQVKKYQGQHKRKNLIKLGSMENSDIQNATTESFATEYKLKKKDTRRNNTPISAYRTRRNLFVDIDKFNDIRNSTLGSTNLDSSRKFPALNQKQADKTYKSAQLNFREELINTIFRDPNFDSKKLVQISQMITDMNEIIDPDKLPDDLNYEYINFLIDQISKKINKSKETSKSDTYSYEEEFDQNFRLPILKSNKSILKFKDEYIDDFIKDKVRDINAIKTLDIDGHKQIEKNKRVQKVEPEEFLTNDQRFFQKIYGNMTVGCLRAVDKAYEERNMNDRRLSLEKKCEEAKKYEKSSRKQIDQYKEEQIKETIDNSRKESLKLDEARKKAEKNLEEAQKKVKIQRENMINFKKNRRRDILLAIEFSKQHISVSKALQRHEFILKKENIMNQKSNFVLDYRTDIESQADLVKKFIHQRSNMRQLQSVNDRTVIDNKLKDDKELHLERARNRVKLLRSVEPLKQKALGIYKYKFESPMLHNSEYSRPNSVNTEVPRRNETAFMDRLNTNDGPFKLVN